MPQHSPTHAYSTRQLTLTALTNSSFFTHRYTASLWGHPTQPRCHLPLKPPHLHPQYPLHAHPWTCYCNDITDNHKSDIIALTETCIRSSTTPAELINFTPLGYSLFSAPRSYTSNLSKLIFAGGTAFLIKEPFIQNSAAHHYYSFEYSSITLKFPKAQHTQFNVYRSPPPSPYCQPVSLPFLTNSHRFSSMQPPPSHEFIITGDFNIHVDDLGDTETIPFFYLLASCNLTQHVQIPTHIHGHTLDLIITPANTTLNPIITSSHIVTSDHYPIFTNINVHPKSHPPPTTFIYRRINAIDYPEFIDDLNSSPLITNPPSCLPDLLDSFSQPFAHYSIIKPSPHQNQ